MKDKQLKFFQGPNQLVKIKKQLDRLLQNHSSLLGARISLFCLLINLATILILISRLPPQVPLFYSQPWGGSQLANKTSLFLPLLIYLLILVFNLRLASLFIKKKALLAKILVWTNVVLGFLLTTSITRIILTVI